MVRLAAAGAVALAGLYLRGGALLAPSAPAAASPVRTYCYESVTTLAADDAPATGPLCLRVQEDGYFASVVPPDQVQGGAAPAVRPGHVIPGLWDGHGHLLAYGESLASVDLFGAVDARDVRHRLHAYLARHADAGGRGNWLRGFGWDQMQMTGGAMPTAALLDTPALRGRYILLDRVDGHCVWVSQAVLDLLPAALPDVPGGEVVRTPGLGVFCDNAMDLVLRAYPPPSRAAKTAYIRQAMRQLRSLGLVGMHDAGVVPADLALYQTLAGNHPRPRRVGSSSSSSDDDDSSDDSGDDYDDADGWTLRVYAMVECDARNTFCPQDVAALRQQEGSGTFLAVRSVKLFADGALGSWGSALLAPYSDRPDTRGSLLVGAAALARLARDWAAAGFQVCIHAIGDRANRYAVDALEAALVALCQPPAGPLAACQRARFRFRVEHAQVVHPRDRARMHELALVPSVQPTHATSDMAYAARRLGADRTRDEAYRMRSFLHGDGGGGDSSGGSRDGPARPLVLGSDFPIEPPDPFQGLYAAVARRSPHTGRGVNGTDAPWYPDEALTLDEALLGFTRGPAYGAFLDGRAGVIQAGALADWVVLDQPLAALDLEALRSLRVRETWVGGRRVYRRT